MHSVLEKLVRTSFENTRTHYDTDIFLFVSTAMKGLDASFYLDPSQYVKRHISNLIGEVDMTVGEVRRTPAGDG